MSRRYSRRRGGVAEPNKPMDPDVKPDAAAAAAPAPAPTPPSAPSESSEHEQAEKTGLSEGGRRRSRRHRHHRTLRPVPKGVHVKAKTLKRLLKSKGLKTTGKKSTLRARAREARLIRGGH